MKRAPLKPATTNTGKAIRFIRIAFDLSAKEICESQGMSRAHYCLVENGKAEPSIEYARVCARALGVETRVILRFANALNEVSTPEDRIVRLGRILKKEVK